MQFFFLFWALQPFKIFFTKITHSRSGWWANQNTQGKPPTTHKQKNLVSLKYSLSWAGTQSDEFK